MQHEAEAKGRNIPVAIAQALLPGIPAIQAA
jgi:hypothetical protein